jgi:hypothetical protein
LIISGLWAPRSAVTMLFDICIMAVEAGIPQFHESVSTTTVEVPWLSKKPRFYCLLYSCFNGKSSTFVCLFHWSEHMIVTEGHVWTAGGMWKNFPPKRLQLLTSSSCRIGSAIDMGENDTTR